MDKAGNIVGYMFVPSESGAGNINVSEYLVEHGFASVHFTAEKSKYYTALTNAEERAKRDGRRVINHRHIQYNMIMLSKCINYSSGLLFF